MNRRTRWKWGLAIAVVAAVVLLAVSAWTEKRAAPPRTREAPRQERRERPRRRRARTVGGEAETTPPAQGQALPVPDPEIRTPGEPIRTIDVTVLSPAGVPQPGADVRLWIDRPRSGYTDWREGPWIRADEQGRAKLELEGGYRFQVNAAHVSSCGSSEASKAFRGGPRLALTVRLEPGVRIRGIVLDAETLAPIEGARVSLFDVPFHETVPSGADGAFETRPAPKSATRSDPGHPFAEPRAWAEGYAPRSARVVRDGDFVRITLERATRVRGRLVDRNGAPVAGLHCKLRANDGEHYAEATSDGQGRIACWLWIEGDGPVDVWPSGSHPRRAVVRTQGDVVGPHERDLGPVLVQPAGTVSGIIVDRDGNPAHRAHLWIEPEGGGPVVDRDSTDSDGLFAFDRVGPGPHVVHARAHGADSASAITMRGVLAGREGLRLVLGSATGE